MARKIFYRVADDGKNFISSEEWDAIRRLQHWYNSEFFWSGGKLNFRRYVVFPNYDSVGNKISRIRDEFLKLEQVGYSEEEIINKLEADGLIIVKHGGYEDGVIASGVTRVANNEFNAYLVLDFLLKVSRIAPTAVLEIYDEGNFVKTHGIRLENGDGTVEQKFIDEETLSNVRNTRRVFAIVNPEKYNGHSEFSNYVSDFNELCPDERAKIVEDWNWLGYESKTDFDFDGDDFFGFDLNQKLCHLFFI
jgi:hypothetical protein